MIQNLCEKSVIKETLSITIYCKLESVLFTQTCTQIRIALVQESLNCEATYCSTLQYMHVKLIYVTSLTCINLVSYCRDNFH